jgi:hypothetical protein
MVFLAAALTLSLWYTTLRRLERHSENGTSASEDNLGLLRRWNGTTCEGRYMHHRPRRQMTQSPGPWRPLGFSPLGRYTLVSRKGRLSCTSRICGEIGSHQRSKSSCSAHPRIAVDFHRVIRWPNSVARLVADATYVENMRTATIFSSHVSWAHGEVHVS